MILNSKFYIFTLFIILISFTPLQAQKNKTLEIWLHGQYYPAHNPCKDSINLKYGFTEIMKGRFPTKKITRHNAKVEKKLTEMHGKLWKIKYEREIEKCPKTE